MKGANDEGAKKLLTGRMYVQRATDEGAKKVADGGTRAHRRRCKKVVDGNVRRATDEGGNSQKTISLLGGSREH